MLQALPWKWQGAATCPAMTICCRRWRTLEWEKPGVFDHSGEEDAAKAFGGSDEALTVGGGCTFLFSLYANGVGGIGCNGQVIGGHGEAESW